MVNIDLSAPVVTIISPTNGTFVGNSVLTWSASDLSGIVLAEISSDGSTWNNVNGTTSDLRLGEGPQTVYVRVTDAAGRISVAAVSFIKDSTPPTLTLNLPSEGSYLNSRSITISWTASDLLSGVEHYEVSIDGISWAAISSDTYTFSDLEDGDWTIYVRAFDTLGNVREISASFIIDTLVPIAEVSPTGSDIDIFSDIVIRFSEAMNEASVTITIDGLPMLISWSGSEARCSHPALECDSYYTVAVLGQDIAGNEMGTSWTFETTKTGDIIGTLTDESGAPLSNVAVELSTGIITTTNAFGRYTFSNVTAGLYTITVLQEGFEPMTMDVEVVGGESTTIGTSTLSAADGDLLSSNLLLLMLGLALVTVIVLGSMMVKRRR